MATIPDIVAEGMSENELAAEINFSLQCLGADKPAFDTISSFGKNSAEPHYGHGDVKLENGSFVLWILHVIKIQFRYHLYVCLGKRRKHKEIYETVFKQQIVFNYKTRVKA
jgi:hypothetical protein